MASLVERAGPLRLRPPSADPFAALVRAIMYQQLATGAASAIHARLLALFDWGLTPEAVIALPDERLRGAGLSQAKAASIRDLAQKSIDGTVPLHGLPRMDDEEIVLRLSRVRGIGRWTAEMFLIFELRRMDVWPVDDHGVRHGWALAHGLDAPPTARALQPEGERFRPYRTVVAWYCWRAVHLARGRP